MKTCHVTLRVVSPKGWSAKGLLQPLWKAYPGGRDALAKAVGTNGADLSSRNTGRRNLGHDLAGRLATELSHGLKRQVTVWDLGAPLLEEDEAQVLFVARLQELEAEVLWLRDLVTRGFEALGIEPELREATPPPRVGDAPQPGRPR